MAPKNDLARLEELVESLRESRRHHEARLETLDSRLGGLERSVSEQSTIVRQIDRSLVQVATAMEAVEKNVTEMKDAVRRQTAANRATIVTLIAAVIGLVGALASAYL